MTDEARKRLSNYAQHLEAQAERETASVRRWWAAGWPDRAGTGAYGSGEIRISVGNAARQALTALAIREALER